MAQVMQLGARGGKRCSLTLCVSGDAVFMAPCLRLPTESGPGPDRRLRLRGVGWAGQGPQIPVYFVAITSVFLTLRRDWGFLFSRWHLAGWAVFVLIVGLWQLPFSRAGAFCVCRVERRGAGGPAILVLGISTTPSVGYRILSKCLAACCLGRSCCRRWRHVGSGRILAMRA